MRIAATMLALCGFAAAAAASAQPAPAPAPAGEITLRPGEAVTFRLDDGGRLIAPERGRAEWSQVTVAAARQLVGRTPLDAPEAFARPVTADEVGEEQPAEGRVRLRFFSIDGRHSLLAIDNGLAQTIAYRATMRVNGRERQTDVCIVPRRIIGIEHWPHPIEQLRLSGFHAVTWQEGQPIPCA